MADTQEVAHCSECGREMPNAKHDKVCPVCERSERLRQRRISDNLEAFYNPKKHRARLQRQQQLRNALSEVFVGGLSYDDY
jgi:methionyl-tRNA synthetase